ncbi:hypothetical protein LCGC14_0271120 [marine sediment metagenome]|uniref:Uncharacterized protein n=1 Tax=marine sediment metagenome TaxID=412755 RepID=A0A0F9X416_9ZZZZ
MSFALEKQRVAHLYAARLLLRQLRSCGEVWSDGRTVYRGAELNTYRVATLDRIVSLKERNPDKRRTPKMERMTRNLSLGQSFLGKQKDENTAEWLSRLLTDYGTTMDIGGRQRSLTARRLLRKNFPSHAAALDRHARYDAKEWSYVLRSHTRHSWVLKDEMDIGDGLTLAAGVTVMPSNRGFLASFLDFQFPVQAQHVCKAKDFRPKRQPCPTPRNPEIGLDL